MQFNRQVLAPAMLSLCLLFSGVCLAQGAAPDAVPVGETQSRPLPEWMVLVLQPLPGKRARPVTGVVVSAGGLIMVPMEFASAGDQVIVLDGGTDIIENGRAVTVLSTDTEAGITLLSAPKLRRQPPSLSSTPFEAGTRLEVAAFPPAELIAQGAQPVWKETRLADVSAEGLPLLVAEQLPPNLTAALLDECGNLAGFSSSTGVQSMETSPQPRYLWKQGLIQALEKANVRLAERSCSGQGLPVTENIPGAADAVSSGELNTAPVGLDTDNAQTGQQGNAVSDAGQTAVAESPGGFGWLVPLLVMLLLVFMFVTGWLLWRQRSQRPAQPESLLTDNVMDAGPRVHSPAPAAPPADCTLRISGRLSNGSPFEAACEVSSAAIDVVIGRGNVDIVIDSPDVHREHARLGGSSDLMTLADLGSARGSWINRIPCLKGEIMYISPDDLITLGDVSFRVTTSDREAGDDAAGDDAPVAG